MIKKIVKILLSIISILIMVVISINLYVLSFWNLHYYTSIQKLPESKFWLVFWASVNKFGTPSQVLKDRLQVAHKAYKNQKIKQIIVSWYVSPDWYNEPKWMEKYLIKLWVKKEHIILDENWIDTYNSLLQTKKIIQTERVTLFSQDFQLTRAHYISAKLWIRFYGMQTNLREYKKENYIREIWARIKAFFEVNFK